MKYRDPHTQIRNDVLLNLTRAKLPKVMYYRFLMVLFRETFGRKRQKGKELGKYMEWEPSVFIEHGVDKTMLSRTKKELLDLRVLRSKKNRIGFNWHFKQWKTDWYVDPAVNSSKDKELTQQSTTVDPAVNKSLPSSQQDSTKSLSETASSAPKETKKRKKVYCAKFNEFWTAFPKKVNKQKAGLAYRRYTETQKTLEHHQIMFALKAILPTWEARISETKKKEPQLPPTQYIPNAERFLNDLARGEYQQSAATGSEDKRVLDLKGFIAEAEENYRKWGDIEYKEEIQYWKDKLAYYLKKKANFNQIIIVGRLGRSPEITYLSSGVAKASLAIATDRGYYDAKKKEYVEKPPEWHNVEAWRDMAESLSELKKGDAVLVIGSKETDVWENREGVKQYTVKIKPTLIAEVLALKAPEKGSRREDKPEPSDDIPF